MVCAAIVQARVASSRLPGKILARIGQRTVLEHVLARCRAIAGVDVVVCAIADTADCNILETLASNCGVEVYRGSELDLLQRHVGAARAVHASNVIRITSDCPLVDPELCAAVISFKAKNNLDFACNNVPRTWPHGVDCDVFSFRVLEEASYSTRNSYDREHVTPWMRRSSHLRRGSLRAPDRRWATWRWTLDYAEDLSFFRALAAAAGSRDALPDLRAAVAILELQPELRRINVGRNQHPPHPAAWSELHLADWITEVRSLPDYRCGRHATEPRIKPKTTGGGLIG